MRVQIARKLKNRSNAIRRAVIKYNDAAVALSPPRRTVDWEEISHFEFLQDFSLLRIMDPKLLERPWTSAPTRHAMRQRHRILRAKEEITRCNIECRRLLTSILDEAHDLSCRIKQLKSSGEAEEVINAVSDFIQHRQLLNKQNLQKVRALISYPGYTGHTSPGIRKGSAVCTDKEQHDEHVDDILTSPIAATEEDVSEGEEFDAGEDDQTQQLDSIIEYISNVSTL